MRAFWYQNAFFRLGYPYRQTFHRYPLGQESEYDWHSTIPERRLTTSQATVHETNIDFMFREVNTIIGKLIEQGLIASVGCLDFRHTSASVLFVSNYPAFFSSSFLSGLRSCWMYRLLWGQPSLGMIPENHYQNSYDLSNSTSLVRLDLIHISEEDPILRTRMKLVEDRCREQTEFQVLQGFSLVFHISCPKMPLRVKSISLSLFLRSTLITSVLVFSNTIGLLYQPSRSVPLCPYGLVLHHFSKLDKLIFCGQGPFRSLFMDTWISRMGSVSGVTIDIGTALVGSSSALLDSCFLV
ncbi:hypothetical protein Tco_1000446 [Tanacetum coccineum]